jgi:alkyl hydroperoxide reductase subunit AhpC
LKQDYKKILKAGADLIMISPDSLEEHRQYALTLFREELPYLYVSDGNLEIGREYGLIREKEHPHGGFYYRSLWILDREAMIVHKSVPWEGNSGGEEYQRLFRLIDSEPGQWRATCGLRDPHNLRAS